MTDTRLMEREAKNQIDKESIEKQNTDIMIKFSIFNARKNSDAVIQYKNLNNQWKKLCTLPELLTVNISETIDEYNITMSEDTKYELERLQKKLSEIWNPQQELYQLSYRKNQDGSSELYIPLETEYTNDIVIQKVYNENEEFVAQNVEENIEFPLYNLESEELFVESVVESGQDVYRLRNKRFEEYLNKTKKKKLNWIIQTGMSTIMFYGFLALMWQDSIYMAVMIFSAATMIQGLSFIIPAIFVYESLSFVEKYFKYRKSSQKTRIKSFSSVPQ